MGLLQSLLPPMWHWVCWSVSKLGPRAPLGSTKKERPQAPLHLRNRSPNGCFHATARPPLPLPPPPVTAPQNSCAYEKYSLLALESQTATFGCEASSTCREKPALKDQKASVWLRVRAVLTAAYSRNAYSPESVGCTLPREENHTCLHVQQWVEPDVWADVTVPSNTSLAHWQFKPPWLPPDWVPAMFLAQERTQPPRLLECFRGHTWTHASKAQFEPLSEVCLLLH